MNDLQTNEKRVLTPQMRYRETREEGESRYSISIYRGETATKQEIGEILQSLSNVFPTYTKEKMAMLVNTIYDECFTRVRLIEAIKYVIKTCIYKEPTIADIVSFDKCVKLYTYSEACRLVTCGQARFDNDGGDLKLYCKRPICLWYIESERAKAMGGL